MVVGSRPFSVFVKSFHRPSIDFSSKSDMFAHLFAFGTSACTELHALLFYVRFSFIFIVKLWYTPCSLFATITFSILFLFSSFTVLHKLFQNVSLLHQAKLGESLLYR